MRFRVAGTIFIALVTPVILTLRGDEPVTATPAKTSASTPRFDKAHAFAISGTVSSISRRIKRSQTVKREKQTSLSVRQLGQALTTSNGIAKPDLAINLADFTTKPMPNTLFSFPGLSNLDNALTFGLLISPPDMVGEGGPNHYVQVVNTLFRIFDKSGNDATTPIPINALFVNLGTPCSLRNDGLPNVLYDQLADRWIISQVCSNFPPFRQLIAVSKSGDPLGQWFAYEFVMPNVKLNDFPKMSVWTDAYYMTGNEILGSDYVGTGIFAFDRKEMLAGDPEATYVYLSLPSDTAAPGGMLPADLDGLTPPPTGTAAIIATHAATEYGHPADAIRLFDFRPNFANPAASTLIERAESPIVVASFDPTSPPGRADISQPPPGEKLDSVSDTLMSRLAYRNFGSHQSLVTNQTVRASAASETYRAGVRVYELRNAGSGFAPFVQSTIGDNTSSRWIGSAAQDNAGNLGVQYNFASDEKKVSIAYTGRLASEPPNEFRSEGMLVEGSGVQRLFGWRWGEYSAISIDPADDCTFWFTNAYYTLESQNFSELGWLTRIGSFKFPECMPAPSAVLNGVVTNAATGNPIEKANVVTSVYTRMTAANGSYGSLTVVPGPYSVTASTHGYRPQSVTVNLANGQTATQNFALEPIPVVTSVGTQVSAESCPINGSPDPGEAVTLAISLRNNGARDAANLIATLLPGGGVMNPGPPQNYGSLAVNGPAVSRQFTFTVDPAIDCGSAITLSLQLNDGAEDLGVATIELSTGVMKIAFRESFDRVPFAGLPPRWSRAATDVGRNWRIAGNRNTSPSKSLFSPAPFQVGLNEVTSPIFQISSSNARLTFQNWYELETTFLRNRLFDGSVLEIKIGNSDWQDILAAGGVFEGGGYDGVIDSCCQNPLGGRHGWSGRSGVNQSSEFITTSVKLPVAAAGQRVQLRWRIGTDIGTFREGQYIDDILVTNGSTCACAN